MKMELLNVWSLLSDCLNGGVFLNVRCVSKIALHYFQLKYVLFFLLVFFQQVDNRQVALKDKFVYHTQICVVCIVNATYFTTFLKQVKQLTEAVHIRFKAEFFSHLFYNYRNMYISN